MTRGVRHEPLPELGPMLAGLRGRHGLSVRGAARRVGLSASFWCEMEGGKRSPSTVTAGWIAAAFSLTAGEQAVLDLAAVDGVGRAYVHEAGVR